MRNAIIGVVIGVVVGIALGAMAIAPRLAGGAPHNATAGTRPGAEPAMKIEPLQPQGPARAGIAWRMASAFSAQVPLLGAQAKRLEKEIWRVSGGGLEIRFHGPGTLMAMAEAPAAVAAGTIEAMFGPAGWSGQKSRALALFSAIPFGPPPDELLAWMDFGGGRALFEALHRKAGVHALSCGVVAAGAGGWFRREIKTVDDLKGLKMGISGLGAGVVSRLGAQARALAGGNIFVAFENGEIDAVVHSMPAIDLQLGLHRHGAAYYLPGWQSPAGLLALQVNLKAWNGLPAARKAQIGSVCGDNIRFGLAEAGASQFAALKTMAAAGVDLRRWPVEVAEALHTAWGQSLAELRASDAAFNKVWQSLLAFREDYAIWRDLARPN